MNKTKNAQDYRSVMDRKPSEIIKLEAKNIIRWAPVVDKYANKEHLLSSEKLDILNDILKERGDL